MPVKQFENFLYDDVYDYTISAAEKILTSGDNLLSSNYHWHYDVVKDSFPVLIHKIDKKSYFYEVLKDNIENKTGLVVSDDKEIMIYYWTRYSYIPWHGDGDHYGGLTVYLNREWNPDYGGYFLFKEDNDNIRAIPPQQNMAILQTENVPHCTTPVTFDGGIRITLQVFFSHRFNGENEDKKLKILKFSAPWCNSCKYVTEVLDNMNLGIEIVEIDVEKNEHIAKKYRVDSWPTLLLVEGGAEVKRILGPQNEEQILNWINN
jgi:thiol-disulfide isomerase/thioredoxin